MWRRAAGDPCTAGGAADLKSNGIIGISGPINPKIDTHINIPDISFKFWCDGGWRRWWRMAAGNFWSWMFLNSSLTILKTIFQRKYFKMLIKSRKNAVFQLWVGGKAAGRRLSNKKKCEWIKYQIIDNMANFQPFISTKSAQKSLCSYVRELEGVHARIPQLLAIQRIARFREDLVDMETTNKSSK